jgi:hypothetical protein
MDPMAVATTNRVSISWVVLLWLVVGVIVALNQDYGRSLDSGSEIATFLLGVILWPVLATGGDVAIVF